MFYAEKFEPKDEENIWKELAYWVKNPITEDEQKERDKEIKKYIDFITDKI